MAKKLTEEELEQGAKVPTIVHIGFIRGARIAACQRALPLKRSV